VYNFLPINDVFKLYKNLKEKLYNKKAKLAPLKLNTNGISLIDVSINSASNKKAF
jgi:hypothetical protein